MPFPTSSSLKPLHFQSNPNAQARIRPKGRQADALVVQELKDLFAAHWGDPIHGYPHDMLIEYLHVLNDHFGALFERHLVSLAALMRLPMVAVFEVASFYHHFEIFQDTEQAPHYRLRVCDGLACSLAGSDTLLDKLKAHQAQLNLPIQVSSVPCVGRCEQAPAVHIGQYEMGHAHFSQVCEAIQKTEIKAKSIDDALLLEAYVQQGGYSMAQKVLSGALTAEAVLQCLEDSGLRGLGGAGFPVARKWSIVRKFASPRLMAVNIDEGEPGTFKDRSYLERDPHRFIEGIVIAAHVVGIERVYIYLRDEYHAIRHMLSAELAKLKANPPCVMPELILRRGAGAYICGEESAMIESIEGKRGEPRLRPPYIAEVGLFGRPTLEHNFESLHWIRYLLEQGAASFASHGRRGRKGLRSFSVSGRVKSPGVKLAPAGISLHELIDEYCDGMAEGHKLYGYLPGGASGGILPASLADIALDFDTLQAHGCFIGSAAVIVLSEQDKARDAALNVMKFFAHESCGQCTPCRVGTEKAAQLMQAKTWDVETLQDLSQVMADASICGLGQAAPNPIRTVLQYFPHEVK